MNKTAETKVTLESLWPAHELHQIRAGLSYIDNRSSWSEDNMRSNHIAASLTLELQHTQGSLTPSIKNKRINALCKFSAPKH